MPPSNLRIIVLCDDATAGPDLVAEHGLSLLIEAPSGRFLLDTGASAAFLRNARTMGVGLGRLDAVVLSHGHYDHTGGLGALLMSEGPQTVVAHPHLFRRRWARHPGKPVREIGPPLTQAAYKGLGATFRLSAEPVWWGETVATTGQVPDAFGERRPGSLCVEREEAVVPDDFADDLSLLVRLPTGLVVITGCAHAGLRNIVSHAMRLRGMDRVHAVIGGTHLVAYERPEVREIARWLTDQGVAALAPCHCTGKAAMDELADSFGGLLAPLSTGSVIEVSPTGDVATATWAGGGQPLSDTRSANRAPAQGKEETR